MAMKFRFNRILFTCILAFLFSGASLFGIGAYKTPAEVNRMINQLQSSNSNIVRIHKLAVSPGGTEMLLLEIGSEVKTESKTKPAILVVGNMSGTRMITTEAALNLAEKVIANQDLYMKNTWYILPLGNPDAASRYFGAVKYSYPGNFTPHNDDMDEQTDEDGFDDLDGNGFITSMRLKAPDGEWIEVEGDKRLMRRADVSKGEKGVYKIYSEGIDNDNDGKYNEDGKGGTDPNINFPHLFKYFAPTSGLYPGSSPESSAILKFAFAHPELAMVFAFGETNFLITPPKGGRQGSVDMEKITIPEEIGKELGFETNRTYSMSEIMEKVRPMIPPGMEIDEGMIASFLGLGAIVNPLSEDLVFYNKISEEYKKYLEDKGSKNDRLDPVAARDGSLELWSYYQLGLPIFSMDLWGLPTLKEEKKEASGISAESLENMSSDEFLALGEEKINLFLKEIGAPAQYTAAMITGAVKAGQLSPKQIAGMLKQIPKPSGDAAKGDPKEQALLAFWKDYREDAGFINWKPYSHPTLGEVEIGGFIPFTDNTPPVTMVDSILNINIPFIFELVKKLPSIHILDTKVKGLGSDIYQVEAWIENNTYLPFTTAMGLKDKEPVPAIITVDGSGVEILSGKKRTPMKELAGMKSVKYTWIIKASKGSSLGIKLESARAGSDSKQIKIGG